MQNPMMNAVFNSLMMNAGTMIFSGVSSRVDGGSLPDKSKNSCKSSVRVLCNMNVFNSPDVTFQASANPNSGADSGPAFSLASNNGTIASL